MKSEALLCLIALSGAAFSIDAATPAWPAFRGPNSSGVSADAKPPIRIGPTNSVLWKIQVPWSASSPCIWGEELFLTTYADSELQTRCYQRRDGKLVWSRGIKPDKLETYHRTEGSPATSSPAGDGERVVS